MWALLDPEQTGLWLPMAASIVTGAAIGFERELQAKAAGVRTHALVCFSSALLMMAAGHQSDWLFDALPGTQIVSDPTRMAHGILTGIGFVGAGVIFKQGNAVRGLTTAASVWVTAALGVLYGAGLTALALSGTVTALVVLVIFRLFQALIPDRIEVIVHVTCDDTPDLHEIAGVMAQHAVEVGQVATRRAMACGGRQGEVHLASRLWMRQAVDLRTLDRALCAVPGVTGISISPTTDGDLL
ncbi:MAG: MgtC/SapB family protein [Gemmobacter sp.]|nr:MgtC/SapB family protein [Gemmobacter sp.]